MIIATTVLSILGFVLLSLCSFLVILSLVIPMIEQELRQRERRKRATTAKERLRNMREDASYQATIDERFRKAEEALRRLQEQQNQKYASYTYTYQTYTPPPRRKGVVTRGDVRAARALLAKYGGYKNAVKQTHPDYGGNARDFDAVIKAKKLVDRFPHVI